MNNCVMVQLLPEKNNTKEQHQSLNLHHVLMLKNYSLCCHISLYAGFTTISGVIFGRQNMMETVGQYITLLPSIAVHSCIMYNYMHKSSPYEYGTLQISLQLLLTCFDILWTIIDVRYELPFEGQNWLLAL